MNLCLITLYKDPWEPYTAWQCTCLSNMSITAHKVSQTLTGGKLNQTLNTRETNSHLLDDINTPTDSFHLSREWLPTGTMNLPVFKTININQTLWPSLLLLSENTWRISNLTFNRTFSSSPFEQHTTIVMVFVCPESMLTTSLSFSVLSFFQHGRTAFSKHFQTDISSSRSAVTTSSLCCSKMLRPDNQITWWPLEMQMRYQTRHQCISEALSTSPPYTSRYKLSSKLHTPKVQAKCACFI